VLARVILINSIQYIRLHGHAAGQTEQEYKEEQILEEHEPAPA
jgi:hypothetical protein